MIYYYNIGTTHLCSNPVFLSRMKHGLNYHFICQQVQSDVLHEAHVFSDNQLVDALTKQDWTLLSEPHLVGHIKEI